MEAPKKGAAWVKPSFGDFSSFSHDTKTRNVPQASRKRPRDQRGDPGATRVSAGGDESLWPDKYAPKTADELAVHKKKIEEVKGWLMHSFTSRTQHASMLLLTGASGVGKSATVRALASDLQCEVREWINPVAPVYDDSLAAWQDQRDFAAVGMSTHDSQATQFQEFLLRANRYPTLQIFQQHQLRNKLILVEDFPNVFFRDVTQFHSILRDYHKRGHCPLVFIISDNAGGDSNERLLFPKDFQAELNIANISFNPVAPTSLVKVLTKIASNEASKSGGKMKVPDKSELDELASNSAGDIRAAISALQFSCLRGKQPQNLFQRSVSRGKGSSTSLKGRLKGSKRGAKKSVSTGDNAQELASIGGKDTSLFLFRALGKILYCKRGDPAELNDTSSLPSHLNHCYRDPLLIHPEDVIEKSQLSSEFFTSYLHENYLDFYSCIEDVVCASEYLSDADYLTVQWSTRSTMRDYASSVAARGLMFSNTARATSSGKSSSGLGFKPLHKPQWFSVCKQARERVTYAKQLFKGCCPPVPLQTQVIPYMAAIRPETTSAQRMFVNEVGKMQKYTRRMKVERLDENDVTQTTDVSESQVSAQTINTPVPGNPGIHDLDEDDQGQIAQPEEEEEIVIDDFDD